MAQDGQGGRPFGRAMFFRAAAAALLLLAVSELGARPAQAQGSSFTSSTTNHSTFTFYGPTSAFLSTPSVLAAFQELSASGFSATNLNHVETSVTATTTFGPSTILIGEDQSQTFFVPAGTLGAGSNFKLSVAYDAEIRSNARNHTIQAQLKMRW